MTNTNRRREVREHYDSALDTIDSISNVALFAFVHDTVGPRPREVAALDSVSVRLDFSQPLGGSLLDSAHLRVLELPDSTPVPVAAVLTKGEYDSLAAAQRVKRDTADTGAVERLAPPAPLPEAAAVPPRPGARVPVRVDTALVRRLLAERTVPTDRIVLRFARALKPETRYLIRVRGATNLNGATADGQIVLLVPKAAAADTTRRGPARPPQPPPPPPPPPPR